jgi:hypothetical protein
MAWTAKHGAGFTKPLIRQLAAFVQRDQRAALDYVGGTGVLPDIVTYQLSPQLIPQFPGVLLSPGPTVFDLDSNYASETGGSIHYTTAAYCSIAVTHQDQETLSELLQDYTRALDLIFNSLALADFYSAWPLTLPVLGAINTTPLDPNHSKVEALLVASHTPEIRHPRNKFAMAATLELHLEMEET